MMQTMLWMMWVACVTLFVLNRTAGEVDGETEQPLDIYPIVFMGFLLFLRSSIIAIRYATTHSIILDGMQDGEMSMQAYRERLLSIAWITMSPHIAL